MASYITVHVEYFVTVIDPDGLPSDKPHLQSTDQEDEMGQPQGEKEEELKHVVPDDIIPKPDSNQLLRLYRETFESAVNHRAN